MSTALELAPRLGVMTVCLALGVARATFYRAHRPVPVRAAQRPRAASPRALSGVEQDTVMAQLHDPVYADRSPRTVFARLLNAGRYLASVTTFYRLLRAAGETR